MRRFLVPLLLAPLALTAAPADAGCDPETGQCHAVDCLAWDPATGWKDAVERAANGDPGVILGLLPPVCPQ